MELNKQQTYDPKKFAKKQKLPDLTDVTLLNTPMPQACSTVDRKSVQNRRSNLDEQNKHRQLNFDNSNITNNSGESSLGIIQNISSLLDDSTLDEMQGKDCPEHVRELARKLLLKCDNSLISSLSKPDKENNVNSTNLQKVSNAYSRSSSIKNRQSLNSNQRRSMEPDFQSVGSSSIVFEPTEIGARSSELNKTPEKTEPFPIPNFSGISYNSNIAELMAQFGDEEFMSGSKAGSQILADEMSWRKNELAPIPVNINSQDKNRLELSCFSGIIDDANFTVDGGRVSIGEFFKNKCAGTGHLSTTTCSERPSFGLNTKSPQKVPGRLRALVDDTVTSEASYHPEEKECKSADCTKEPSVMSLSTIAQVLQDIDSATPRKLVDQILDANKKKRKQRVENNNPACETYTVLPSNRISLPASRKTHFSEKSERDKTQNNYGHKLSLDSKNTSEFDTKCFHELLSQTNNLDPKLRKILESDLEDTLSSETPKKSENRNDGRSSLHQNQLKSPNISVPRAEQSSMPHPRKMSHLPNSHNKFTSSTMIDDKSSLIHDTGPTDASDPTLTKDDSTKEDTLTNSVKNQSFDTRKVEIGKKTHELCTCLVGINKEADFELYNGTDRWILCSLKLHQIQGDKSNIQLELPDDDILIEPDARKSFKIGVKMPHMGKLTIAIFHIPCSDMVTRTSWYMKHLMCFVPEEPDIKISIPSESEMDFGIITEDTSNSLPITLENKNSIEIPVVLYINQNTPRSFNIGECLDDTVSSVSNEKETVCLTLKPRQPVTINVDFRGMSLQSFGDAAFQKGVYNAEAKLKMSICYKANEEYLINEVPLKGMIGSCKLDIVDTQFPLTLQPKVGRVISLKNSGSIAVSATVDIVQSKENQTECRDFFICPNNIVLNGGQKLALQISYKPENYKTDNERQALIRLAVENKVYFYPLIGEKVMEIDHFSSDSFYQMHRSETPQRLRAISSPTSPHSPMFNRSGNSGRHSPGSTASGGTVAGSVVPIRAKETALVWSSIKSGRSDTKTLTIRNTSNNKIKLLATIKATDQTFKFLKDRQTLATSMIFSLQGMESKTLSVVFTPNYPKAAAGKIMFAHHNSHARDNLVKVVKLFGYGGYGKIEISEAVKDTSGQMWLSLGTLNSEGVLHAKIRLQNTGDLMGFTKIKLTPKALYPSSVSNWYVEPTELLLAPNEIQWITMEFRPRRNDIATLHQTGVIHVGTLKIIHGDEPTRLRIRRLYNKLKDSGQLYDKIDEQADEFKEIIHNISRAFPGETFPQDLTLIGDSVQNLGELCKGIVQNEVKLTVEIHPDETISMLQDNMDDSQIFYSLCSDHDESHFGGESYLPAE
ncbi:hypothetical protein TSAR_008772 [Trichomalopsis sarcophagae]|uniref:Abnormal spindle-like microcephaly-associated protein ASH domain-containing protein n=1 Tax=Trichomalopsis sarcophagae TaxID=543379 RepID=A0A232FJY7_9HYME|nr:hypothetical protein TSAR_008772 [Trichomalopsis sarcophagae]